MKNRKSNRYAICAALVVAAAVGCACGPSALGQGGLSGRGSAATAKDEIPSSLEDRLAAALANNPDIRSAQARVQEAEAALSRIRLEVTQRVVAAHNALDTQHNEIRLAEMQAKQAEAVFAEFGQAFKIGRGAVSKLQVDEKKYAFEEARLGIVREESKTGELEAELRYLLGRFPKGVAQQTGKPASVVWFSTDFRLSRDDDKNPMLERIRKPLTKRLSLEFFEQPLADVLAFVHEEAGVPFVIQPIGLAEEAIEPSTELVTVHIKVDSLAAALTVIQDLVPQLRFVVRDYGILVTTERGVDRGAILVHDPFARRKESKEK